MPDDRRKRAHNVYDSAAAKRTPPRRKPPVAREFDAKTKQRGSSADKRRWERLRKNDAAVSRREPDEIAEVTASRIYDAPQTAPKIKKLYPMDWLFLLMVLVLTMFGMVMMYSAGFAWALFFFGDSLHYIKRQVIFGVLGIVVMLLVSRVDYHFYSKFRIPQLGIVAAIFLQLLIIPFGTVVNGAKRWVFGFQPSEIAKFAIILFLSWLVAAAGTRMKKAKYGIMPYLCIIGGTFLLIGLLQKHISATLLIIATSTFMIFIGGANAFHLGGLFTMAGVGGGGLIFLSGKFDYIQRRIAVWRNPESDPLIGGYQTLQSLYAIGSGGLFGLGLGNSRQKQLYLPEAHNDYIFAVVCEELGFVGALIVIVLFGILIFRGYWIAMHAPDRFGCMLAVGITTQLALQTLMNIAVVTNSMPVTGVSLPFFSYGGSSLMMLLAEMGIILNISRQAQYRQR